MAHLPAVHRLLAEPRLAGAVASFGHSLVRNVIRRTLALARLDVRAGRLAPTFETLVERALVLLTEATRPAYPSVLNATGVLIHTNLGRAPRLSPALPAYLALEFDLTSGERGERLSPVSERLVRYFGCEAATVVTNNAAALVLLLAAHASGRPVVVSRGELIEIGGSFRLPDIMVAAGASLLEVGCTNRTHLADYEQALAREPAAFLVVHRSNFHLSGFVTQPSLPDLVAMARQHGIPVWVDQGSGCHLDLSVYGLRHEATAQELLATGADAVLFSADKLLGGPQAGVIVGRARALEPLRRHPLRRALRPDKSALLALAATLDAFLSDRPAEVPLYRLLGEPVNRLRARARRLAGRLGQSGIVASAIPTRAVLGGGTTPDQTLASWGVALAGGDEIASRLRRATPPVVARRDEGRVIVDLRAVFPEHDRELTRTLLTALAGGNNDVTSQVASG